MWSLRKLTNAFDIRYMYMSFVRIFFLVIPRTKEFWSIITFIHSILQAWMNEFYYFYQSHKKDGQYHSYKKVMLFLLCTSCLVNKTQRGEKSLISVQNRFRAYLKQCQFLDSSRLFFSVLQASASMQCWNKNNPVIWLDLIIKFSLKENKSQNEKCYRNLIINLRIIFHLPGNTCCANFFLTISSQSASLTNTKIPGLLLGKKKE